MGGPKKILVIDDQADIRLMCRVNLTFDGYRITEAPDGTTGLAAARAEDPDLILLDVMMPGLDGWQVLEAMKADPATASVPVVMLTARVQREDEIKGYSLGAADYLSKPFNPSTLASIVRQALTPGEPERRRRALEKLSIY